MQVFNYKRIQTEKLSSEFIRRIYELKHSREPLQTLETPYYYLLQYGNEPIIFVGKKTGRLYGLSNIPRNENEKQASFVIRILHSFNLVEEMHSTRVVKL